jgi:hypothetical protein
MLVSLVHRANSETIFIRDLDAFMNTSLENVIFLASNDNEWHVRKHEDENCRGRTMSQHSPGEVDKRDIS